MKHRTYPCNECPWKVTAEPGKFPAERYVKLRSTCRPDEDGMPPMPGSPMFGCHKGEPGTDDDLACAGWLAREGHNHIGVRLAIMNGDLPMEALEQNDTWPDLYDTYEDMAAANGANLPRDPWLTRRNNG